MDLGKAFGEEAITRHAHPNSWLSQLEDQEHRGHGDHGTHRYDPRHPTQVGERLKDFRQGICHSQRLVGDHARQDERDDDIQDRADDERIKRGTWKVPFGIFAFF